MSQPRTPAEIASDLRGFISASYPNIEIRVQPWEQDPSRLAVFFIEELFSLLYPYQRWHYLSHLIPEDYQKEHLATSVWFELAPNESPEVLEYPDEEVIAEITPIIMRILNKTSFFNRLDDILCPADQAAPRCQCWGDFRNAKPLLLECGIRSEELFDVFHVLMLQGGFCDCEILYNVIEENRLKAEYWTARAEGRTPSIPITRRDRFPASRSLRFGPILPELF